MAEGINRSLSEDVKVRNVDNVTKKGFCERKGKWQHRGQPKTWIQGRELRWQRFRQYKCLMGRSWQTKGSGHPDWPMEPSPLSERDRYGLERSRVKLRNKSCNQIDTISEKERGKCWVRRQGILQNYGRKLGKFLFYHFYFIVKKATLSARKPRKL